MRHTQGIEQLLSSPSAGQALSRLGEAILHDMQNCRCRILGVIDDQPVLLAELQLVPETLNYDRFDQRIDFSVAGTILRNDCVPLTYRLQGRQLLITGRCSTIPRVCGVDLYLHASYTGQLGDIARQRFAIPIKPLLQQLRENPQPI